MTIHRIVLTVFALLSISQAGLAQTQFCAEDMLPPWTGYKAGGGSNTSSSYNYGSTDPEEVIQDVELTTTQSRYAQGWEFHTMTRTSAPYPAENPRWWIESINVYGGYWEGVGTRTILNNVEICPSGFEMRSGNYQGQFDNYCKLVDPNMQPCDTVPKPDKMRGECGNPMVANPCNAATGNKFEREVDFSGHGPFPLEFIRYYNSDPDTPKANLGHQWRHNYDRKIMLSGHYTIAEHHSGPRQMYLERPDGRVLTYVVTASSVTPRDADVPDTLRQVSPAVFEFRTADDIVETYHLRVENDGVSVFGRLESLRAPGEVVQSLEYFNNNRLRRVVDHFGRKIELAYSGGRVSKMTDPNGEVVLYSYASGYLTKVAYPDDTPSNPNDNPFREYVHGDSANPRALTSLINENGDVNGSWSYDGSGRAISSERANGFNRFDFVYNQDGTTTVEEDDGESRTYTFELLNNVYKTTEVSGTSASSAVTYDYRGYPESVTDRNGVETEYTFDARGLELSRTEAVGTPQERTVTTVWHQNFALPTTITDGPKQAVMQYDSNGLLTAQSIIDTLTSGIRTTTFTYTTDGLLHTIDGPRTDVTDVTTLTYDSDGNVSTVTNPVGHVTTYDAYDDVGRLMEMTDSNGLITSFSYDARGRVLEIEQAPTAGAARTTHFGYDGVGQVTSIQYSNGHELVLTYSEARYLAAVEDNFGNKVEYEYDARGNQEEAKTYDPIGLLKRSLEFAYDQRSRLATVNVGGALTSLSYDEEFNVLAREDPNNHTTTFSYDPLNRLTTVVDAMSGVTETDYDQEDNVTSIGAPNGAVTSYDYDNLGNLIEEDSPDRGTTIYTHDAAGNVITSTDARGKVTVYTYDALDRVTEIVLDNSDTITYLYDSGTNAVGHLSKVTDLSGETAWTYNNFGQVTAKTHKIGGVTLTTAYGYDAGGSLTTITLPSGKVLTYGYNDHLPVSVTVDTTTILSGVTYDPFGPVTGWIWGNSTAHSRSFDLRGLLDSQSMVTDTRTLTYDDAGRLTTLDDSRHDLGFDYDDLGRLTDVLASGSAPLPPTQYLTYDENGNRESITENGTPYSYTNVAYSNRLTSATGPTAKSFTYDAAGNLTTDGIHSYGYDDRGRLVSVDSGAVSYQHNGQGQRVKKDDGSVVTLFAYDETGQLIGEYDGSGNAIQENVWFNEMPVAVLKGSNEYYVHTDHLGTPRIITEGNSVIWRWESDPFGTTAAQEDPDGDLTDFTYNLRLPGQYYDDETGLHYNYFRTYDPSTGRYLESDPIGVAGGLNTYGYVANNPLGFVDPLGLFEIYGHQTRGRGYGWETRFELEFSPLSEKPGDIALKLWKLGNRTKKVLDVLKTDPVGPRRPVGDALECALLDAELEREYADRFGNENRLTRDQALDFLDAMRSKYPEMKELYGSPINLLDTAEQNSKDHWFYQMRPGH